MRIYEKKMKKMKFISVTFVSYVNPCSLQNKKVGKKEQKDNIESRARFHRFSHPNSIKCMLLIY